MSAQACILELLFLVEDTYTIKLPGFRGVGNSESHKMARNKEKETSSIFMARGTLLFLALLVCCSKELGSPMEACTSLLRLACILMCPVQYITV